MVRRYMVIMFSIFGLMASGGCQHAPSQVAPPEPPAMPVSHPVSRPITDYADFTGQTDAVQSVNVIARVTGYLVQMPFKEGAEVKKGDLLFEIDPQPYEAQLHLGEAQVAFNEAQLELARKNFLRVMDLKKKNGVSQQEFDQYKALMDQAAAQLKASEANLEIYKLNVQYTRVTSPIDGQVSRYYLTLGNLVNQDQTLLTTVVSLDPMYAYFDMDEPTLLKIRRAINVGRIKRRASGQISVLMGLQGEADFPHRGTIDFVNNQVNPTTGSITVRGVFPNPKPANGVRLLSPGMFVHIRLPIGEPQPALLVIDRAIGFDQGLKYVYVLGADNKTEYRRITTGTLQEDGLRVVEGLHPDDWVIVGGLQQVRPGMQIRPDQVPMPTIGGQESGKK